MTRTTSAGFSAASRFRSASPNSFSSVELRGLNGGELDGVRLLREETIAAMTEPQTGGLPIDLAGPGYDFGYGVAVLTDPALAKTRSHRALTAGGSVYGTGLSVDPASGLAFVVMTQTAVEGMAISDEFVRAFYDRSAAR